jgi:hypothetical protein
MKRIIEILLDAVFIEKQPVLLTSKGAKIYVTKNRSARSTHEP